MENQKNDLISLNKIIESFNDMINKEIDAFNGMSKNLSESFNKMCDTFAINTPSIKNPMEYIQIPPISDTIGKSEVKEVVESHKKKEVKASDEETDGKIIKEYHYSVDKSEIYKNLYNDVRSFLLEQKYLGDVEAFLNSYNTNGTTINNKLNSILCENLAEVKSKNILELNILDFNDKQAVEKAKKLLYADFLLEYQNFYSDVYKKTKENEPEGVISNEAKESLLESINREKQTFTQEVVKTSNEELLKSIKEEGRSLIQGSLFDKGIEEMSFEELIGESGEVQKQEPLDEDSKADVEFANKSFDERQKNEFNEELNKFKQEETLSKKISIKEVELLDKPRENPFKYNQEIENFLIDEDMFEFIKNIIIVISNPVDIRAPLNKEEFENFYKFLSSGMKINHLMNFLCLKTRRSIGEEDSMHIVKILDGMKNIVKDNINNLSEDCMNKRLSIIQVFFVTFLGINRISVNKLPSDIDIRNLFWGKKGISKLEIIS